MEAHRNLQKEHDSLKTTFADSEKKFQRKLSEMKEIQQLDQQAKVHMEDSFRLSLEEKDEKINVMQMQVRCEREGKRERDVHSIHSLIPYLATEIKEELQ